MNHKKCKNCDNIIKRRTTIDGKVVHTQNRKYCFDCSPFGTGNNIGLKNIPESQKPNSRNSQKRKQDIVRYQKVLRNKRKNDLIELLGGKCSRCGYNKCKRALEFHHLDKNDKKFNLSCLGYTCSWERLLEEAKKCILVCANCHREIEDGLI